MGPEREKALNVSFRGSAKSGQTQSFIIVTEIFSACQGGEKAEKKAKKMVLNCE
jgi:hypothetical protein